MCGINGIFAYADAAPQIDEAELLRTREHMVRRGPDGAGLWISPDRRVGLAHRRLAIIDLAETGAQPMATADSRLTISFNGEIYNYRELRRELEAKGYAFRSQSDTEVLLHLYADRGAAMLHALRGMFAFGIWDARERTLFLARDPFGIKPLYYADDGKILRFASQVKALLAGGAVDSSPDPAGAVGFLLWGCVPEPFTLHQGVIALQAGTHLTVRRKFGAVPGNYFSVRAELVRAQAEAKPFRQTDRAALRELLSDSVHHHLVSDVPVGVFLSAGIDSTLIASLAAERAGVSLCSLTLGFEEYRGTAQDEVPLAERSAATLGTRHETHWIRRGDFAGEVDAILRAMDQPSIDGVNSWFVCRAAARAGLKVALSGLGADEMFGGYPSFRQVPPMARWLRPAALVPRVGRLSRLLAAPFVSALASPKFASLLEYGGGFAGAYFLRRALQMPWEIRGMLDPALLGAGLDRLRTLPLLDESISGLGTAHARVAALEISWYMRNQLLRDADWAGMAHSVEVRVPFVDATLFRALAPWLVSSIAPTKADASAAPRVPLDDAILHRPKSGFTVPVRDWLMGSTEPSPGDSNRGLRGWAKRVYAVFRCDRQVLCLMTDAYGEYGGIAKFNQDLLGSLCGNASVNLVVAVLRHPAAPTHALPGKLKLQSVRKDGVSGYAVAVIGHVIRGRRWDAIVCGHLNLLPFACLAKWLTGAPLALVVHGIEAWNPRRAWLAARLVRSIDLVASVSRLTADRFKSWSATPEQAIHLLPNCVDTRAFSPGPKSPELLARLGLRDRTVIFTLARLDTRERYKGLDEVLEALPLLAQSIQNISYLIAGEGDDMPRLRDKAAHLGVADRVVFAGRISEADKIALYRSVDAFVMRGSGEGFGIVYLEAAACGLPALGSTLDASREALLDGRLGVLVNPREPEQVVAGIREVLSRPRQVPAELETFSAKRFEERSVAMLDRMWGASGHRGPIPDSR